MKLSQIRAYGIFCGLTPTKQKQNHLNRLIRLGKCLKIPTFQIELHPPF